MFIPGSLDLILPDKAATALGHSALDSGKFSKNIEIEEFLEEFLAQLEALDSENSGELPLTENGKLLPLDLPEGNELPPGQVQAFVMQALENPGAMMRLLASLRQELHSQPAMQNIEDAIEGLSATEREHKSLDHVQAVTGKLLQAARAFAKESGDAQQVTFADIDTQIDPDLDIDANRIQRIVPAVDTQVGQSQSQPSPNTLNRDITAQFNTVSSLSPVQQQPRMDAATHVMTIQPQLFKPDWSEAFNSNILIMARDQLQSARLNLNPPELGPIEVRLSVQNDHTNIQFLAQHGAVRDVIEDAMPRLREMMAGSGINLGDVNVSQHSASDRSPTGAEPEFSDIVAEAPGQAEEVIPVHVVSRSLVDHYI